MVPGLAAADLCVSRCRVDGVLARTDGVLLRTSTTRLRHRRPFLSLSTPSLHAVAALKDAAARLGEGLVQTHDDRADAFDRHRQLVLVMF
jgi:hypothetical protein